jgi:hypothetical protein
MEFESCSPTHKYICSDSQQNCFQAQINELKIKPKLYMSLKPTLHTLILELLKYLMNTEVIILWPRRPCFGSEALFLATISLLAVEIFFKNISC